MAIARTGTASSGTATGFSLTVSHDAGSSSNRFLIVIINSGGSGITTVTYAGVAMTQLDLVGTAPYITAWGLENPAVGTNNIVVSAGFMFMQLVAQTYSGVQETTVVDALSGSTDTAVFTTSFTMSTTVVGATCWTFYGVICSNSSSVSLAGAGSNVAKQLLTSGNGSVSLFDSNGIVGPGAISMAATHGSGSNWKGIAFSLADHAGGGGGGGGIASDGNLLLLCG